MLIIDVKPEHECKSLPEFFSEIVAGRKTHDLRRTDRPFKVGDQMLLREHTPNGYTGRVAGVEITYITSADVPCALSNGALHPEFCILSIKLLWTL